MTKRQTDIAIALPLLILTAPLLLIAGLLMKLDSRGPVVIRQVRVGLHGKHFGMYKLRTLPVWHPNTQMHDPSTVGRVGKWIRKRHIDELPQLWNVLVGEMSLVGPRPEQPQFEMPWWRSLVKPGVSGWSQIHGYDSNQMENKLALDREYTEDIYYVRNTLDPYIIRVTTRQCLRGLWRVR